MRLNRKFLQDRADDVGIILLATMFLTFIVQITWRYVLNHPLGWTVELCVTMWLWVVFWGSAFCLKDEEHVRFDMLYLVVRPKLQRIFAGISALAIVVGMAASWHGTYDFVSFLKIKKSPAMRIPLAYLYSIYLLFIIATVATYAWRLKKIFKGELHTEMKERGGLEE
jgi:TRAP-type C4-dicarboxylate transport system permease small subunit